MALSKILDSNSKSSDVSDTAGVTETNIFLKQV